MWNSNVKNINFGVFIPIFIEGTEKGTLNQISNMPMLYHEIMLAYETRAHRKGANLQCSIKHGECIIVPAYRWLYFRYVSFVAWVFLLKKNKKFKKPVKKNIDL